MAEDQGTEDRILACVSVGIPAGTVVFTRNGRVCGMRVGEATHGNPGKAEMAHFSAADFPRGCPSLVEAFAEAQEAG